MHEKLQLYGELTALYITITAICYQEDLIFRKFSFVQNFAKL